MRVANRIAATLLALIIAAAGAVAAVEIVGAALGSRPLIVPYGRWYDDARTTMWSQGSVRLAGFVLLGLGLLLIVLQVVRRRPRNLPVDAGSALVDAEVSRRSLEDSVARLVEQADGVAEAKARVDGGRAVVWAQSNRRDIDGLEPVLGRRVEERLAATHLVEPVSVGVGVEPRPEEGSAR